MPRLDMPSWAAQVWLLTHVGQRLRIVRNPLQPAQQRHLQRRLHVALFCELLQVGRLLPGLHGHLQRVLKWAVPDQLRRRRHHGRRVSQLRQRPQRRAHGQGGHAGFGHLLPVQVQRGLRARRGAVRLQAVQRRLLVGRGRHLRPLRDVLGWQVPQRVRGRAGGVPGVQ
jgi:hypothetical protein